MTVIKDILSAGLVVQSANLALSNLPRKKRKKGLLGQGVDNLVGTSLIQTQANFLGGFD
jgi:hypothetical protein